MPCVTLPQSRRAVVLGVSSIQHPARTASDRLPPATQRLTDSYLSDISAAFHKAGLSDVMQMCESTNIAEMAPGARRPLEETPDERSVLPSASANPEDPSN
ncbi:hypothetical protein BD310DRAFT_450102 [Dichomitus squalens]|uniref:Uncharacterized protein n=1 Tax=Dichomitus squalens TaxID=114155 RepID=A0A4Q9PVZ4_9APHY|nr:hypothetical protein BD310DRAFT_450102 [Dichomitus squalens]